MRFRKETFFSQWFLLGVVDAHGSFCFCCFGVFNTLIHLLMIWNGSLEKAWCVKADVGQMSAIMLGQQSVERKTVSYSLENVCVCCLYIKKQNNLFLKAAVINCTLLSGVCCSTENPPQTEEKTFKFTLLIVGERWGGVNEGLVLRTRYSCHLTVLLGQCLFPLYVPTVFFLSQVLWPFEVHREVQQVLICILQYKHGFFVFWIFP